ncbi:hypothetical protein M3Y98_00839600 [Aphelenchoides besseyi]|nr:hypothetical protein M3Y98_00839600 [Aphelenchoides besseyi]KAI6195500.1 hypothetical protein M3Y96_01238000 [Aphelenchoides besseyi]
MEPLTPEVANSKEASALIYSRGFDEKFCESFGIVGCGAHLCDRTLLKKSTLVKLPCKCSGDLCECGALNFLQLIDKKAGEVLVNEETDSPKWLNSAALPRMSFLNQLHHKAHENEEEKLSKTNRDAIDDLLHYKEYEKPQTKTEIEKKIKMAEEKERQICQTIPIVQFIQKERMKKKRPQSFPHHIKDRIDNPCKLPSHLVTYDELLDFDDYTNEYSVALNSSALTMGDCFVVKERRVSSDSDWSIVTN